ncbi:hypothetical protein PENSPDRAFT_645417 [Peniophora sp. CONT]|nr:hypothetical protein PENSPDRAFT_645417 [Peniophora sp. CONT]
MSADDSMDLDYGLPPSQPAFMQLSHPVVDRRTRIGWQNSQPGSQNALAGLMADVGGDMALFDAAPAPAPLMAVPELPIASSSSSTPATHRPDRRRRRGQREEPEPAQTSSAVLDLLERFTRTVPEQPLSRPAPCSKENRYEREKQRAASSSSVSALSKSKPRSREPSGSSTASSGPRTPDSDISRAWPAPQEGATANNGVRTRSLGSGQITAPASTSIRHHSLPEIAKRLPTENDVSMGTPDGCSVTDAFSRAALDSPSSAVAAWPSPVTEKSSPAPDRHSFLDDTSHLPPDTSELPDTSVLPDTSRLLPPNLHRRSSSPATSSHHASNAARSLSRTSSSSTALPAHRSREPTPQATTSAAPAGNRSLKRTGSRTLSRDDIFKAIATAPPSPQVTRRAPTSRQTAPPGPRAVSHAPNPTQRPKMLGMRREYKPYGAPTTKRAAPPPAAPQASQGFRIQAFKPPLAKKSAQAIVPKPERASTPPRPPPRKQVQAPTPDSSQPQQRKVKAEKMDDESMLDAADSSFADLSFGIDVDTLDAAMEQYD